jgi:hypothetical protein
VVWSSRRQATVSASTVEPEYIALTEAGREVMRLRELLGTLGHRQPMTKLWCDNQGAIALTKKPSSHPRIKHIAIRHHHTRMGRTRDDSTRVRGYEVPEGRHPHQTVAWTGARGLCTRNRSSEAKEGRKGCSWTAHGRGKNEDPTFGLETKRQWVATRYQGGSRPRGCKEAWHQEERSISRGSVSRLELKSWWRSYGMTDEDRAVAVSWTIE